MKGGPTGNLSTQNYSYDRFGNRTNVTATGVAADNTPMPVDGIPNLPLTFNASNNRITTDGFQYDSAGNQTRALGEDGIWLKYEYDAANRLRVVKHDDGSPNGVGKQAFMYGSTNARLIDYDYNVGMNKLFASVGGTTLAEYTEYAGAIPTWTKSYTYLGDGQLSTITPNGQGGEQTEYNHPDRLGVRVTTNPQTGTSTEQAHLPFGKALDAETTRAEGKRFTSYERSARTGLDYAFNRTYDSKQGRFTQVDPIGMQSVDLNNPQTLNLFVYCANDPINQIDPSGLGFFSFIKKLFKWVNRILKWIVVAIAVVAVAIAIFHSGGAAIGFLKAILGIVGKMFGLKVNTSLVITNLAGEASIGLVSTLSISLSGQIIAGAYAVGAVASQFAQSGDGDDDLGWIDENGVWHPSSEPIRIETSAPRWRSILWDALKKSGKMLYGTFFAIPDLAFNKQTQKCFNGNRFSAAVRAVGGDTAGNVAEGVEVGSEIILAGDAAATAYKWSVTSPASLARRGASPMGSSVNLGIRRLGKKVGGSLGKGMINAARTVGKRVNPAIMAAGAFTAGYNYAQAVGCASGIIR